MKPGSAADVLHSHNDQVTLPENRLLAWFSVGGQLQASYSYEAMLCRTWNDLYEQYEEAALKRLAKKDGRFALSQSAELDELNTKIAEALHALRKHEQLHHCRCN
jgi:adenylosuccinate lyase